MSSIIQPWLWPSIEKEVRQVLQWQLEAPANPQAESKVKFEDDGSNLRIPSLERGNCVQILNVRHPDYGIVSEKKLISYSLQISKILYKPSYPTR